MRELVKSICNIADESEMRALVDRLGSLINMTLICGRGNEQVIELVHKKSKVCLDDPPLTFACESLLMRWGQVTIHYPRSSTGIHGLEGQQRSLKIDSEN